MTDKMTWAQIGGLTLAFLAVIVLYGALVNEIVP